MTDRTGPFPIGKDEKQQGVTANVDCASGHDSPECGRPGRIAVSTLALGQLDLMAPIGRTEPNVGAASSSGAKRDVFSIGAPAGVFIVAFALCNPGQPGAIQSHGKDVKVAVSRNKGEALTIRGPGRIRVVVSLKVTLRTPLPSAFMT